MAPVLYGFAEIIKMDMKKKTYICWYFYTIHSGSG